MQKMIHQHHAMRFVGDTIVRYRKHAAMTQKELADILKVTVVTIGRWEKGQHAMPIRTWPDFLAVVGRDTREPYPSQVEGAPAVSPERLVVGSTLEPHIVMELKGLRDSLPSAVRDAIRLELEASRELLVLQVRTAVQDALRDSQSAIYELRGINERIAPLVAEVRLLKDQVIVAVKEALLSPPQRQAREPREQSKPRADKPDTSTLKADMMDKAKLIASVHPRNKDIYTIASNAAGKRDGVNGNKLADEGSVAALVWSITEGLECARKVLIGVKGCDQMLEMYSPDKEYRVIEVLKNANIDKLDFIKRGMAQLKLTGFKYHDTPATQQMLDAGFLTGVYTGIAEDNVAKADAAREAAIKAKESQTADDLM